MSEVIYSNLTYSQPKKQDVGRKVEVRKAASECKEDVTYSEVRIGVRKQVHAGKEREEDVTYSQIKTGAKVQVKSNTVLECEEDVSYSEVKTTPGEHVTAQKELNHGSGDYTTPAWIKVLIALMTSFCVLLLVLAIILGVLYDSNITHLQREKAQFNQSQNNLTDQIDQLYIKHEHCEKNLTGVYDHMAKVQGEKDQLSSNLHYIQQNLTEVKKILAQVQEKGCASGWEFFSGSCYNFSTDKLTWEQSQYACIHDGGHLVIIESLQEQDFIRKKVGNADVKNSYWIGMTDKRVEGTWVWIDNTTLNDNIKYWDLNNGTRNWAYPEPNDWEHAEDCAQIGHRCSGQISCWFDLACDRPSKRICEHHATERTT